MAEKLNKVLNETNMVQAINHPPRLNGNPDFRTSAENAFMRLAERTLTFALRSQIRPTLISHEKEVLAFPPPAQNHEYTLYLHIPFCESLCPYCSFNRYLFEKKLSASYFTALRQEMRQVATLGYDFKTLYIGGGTPTIDLEELTSTIDLARKLFHIEEVSCETNPNHLIPKYIDQLKSRVQRLSVGVQSFDSTLLQQMNRLEKFGNGQKILERIRYAAPFFKSLNVDMIFNFPSQTAEMLTLDLEKIITSQAQQVTFYPLMSAPSVEQSMARSVGRPTHQREWDFFKLIQEGLAGSFNPLSAWTYVRHSADMIDEYIVDNEEYVGIGSGSFSYIAGRLYVNHFSINAYLNAIRDGSTAISGGKTYDRAAQMRYWFMMNLFGLNFDRHEFAQRFGAPPWAALPLEMLFMNLTGSFKKHDRAQLSHRGQYLSLVMMREFFSGVNNLRDIARKKLSPLELASATPVKIVGVHSTGKTPLKK